MEDFYILEHVSAISFAFVGLVAGNFIGIPSAIVGTYQQTPFYRFFNLNGNIVLGFGFVVGLFLDLLVSFGPSIFMFFHFSLITHWLQTCKNIW
jgi:hypothetical protein